MADNFNTIEGTEVFNVNDGVQGSHAITVDGIKNFVGSGKQVYKALLSQNGTDAPVAIVLENTLGGTVVWSRDSAGVYYGTLTGGFPTDKSLCHIGTYYKGVAGTSIMIGAIIYDSNAVQVTTNYGKPSYSGKDNLLYNTSISIEVYP